MPFFPVEDALLPDFQVFGDLSESDDEGFGVDAIAQRLPGHSYFTEYYVNYIDNIFGRVLICKYPP